MYRYSKEKIPFLSVQGMKVFSTMLVNLVSHVDFKLILFLCTRCTFIHAYINMHILHTVIYISNDIDKENLLNNQKLFD